MTTDTSGCAASAVTQEMVTAYLTANDAYWRSVDDGPPAIGVWRNGTPSEATRVSLAAALAAAPDRSAQVAEVMRLADAAAHAWEGWTPARDRKLERRYMAARAALEAAVKRLAGV